MSKSTNFSGQPIFTQLLKFISRGKVQKISVKTGGEKYVKKFTAYHHLVVMLFAVLEGYSSIREVVTGLLSNAHKLQHLGIDYIVRRSTLSDSNKRRSSSIFEQIYLSVYREYSESLSDSRLSKQELKRLYIMDSTTIRLFKAILKGVGRNPKTGNKKGGIKAHTLIKADENVPCLVRYSAATKHDHNFLKEVNLASGSIITFDKAYVDYEKYEEFTKSEIWYVTRQKSNAKYSVIEEFEIPEEVKSKVLKDEKIEIKYGEKKEKVHYARRIEYLDSENNRKLVFLTNNMHFSAEIIALIYKKRWQIELLFKQLKQNFPLKYFLGDNQNAIEIQIWTAMIANLLLSIVKSKVKRTWSFSNMVTFIRMQLMNYINVYYFLEDPEKSWRNIIEKNKSKSENTLFPKEWGLGF